MKTYRKFQRPSKKRSADAAKAVARAVESTLHDKIGDTVEDDEGRIGGIVEINDDEITIQSGPSFWTKRRSEITNRTLAILDR